VDAEQLERDRVDRRCERRDDRGQPEQEQRGPPERPPPTCSGTAQVHAGGEDGEGAKD
jgi:hypothetical protein